AHVIVAAHVVLILVPPEVGIAGEIVHVARQVRGAPDVHENFRRLVESRCWNLVVGERYTSGLPGRTCGRALEAASGVRIVDCRKSGEIAGPHGVGRHGRESGPAIAEREAIPGEEAEELVLDRRSTRGDAILVLRKGRPGDS